jgi:hypothetical protein
MIGLLSTLIVAIFLAMGQPVEEPVWISAPAAAQTYYMESRSHGSPGYVLGAGKDGKR